MNKEREAKEALDPIAEAWHEAMNSVNRAHNEALARVDREYDNERERITKIYLDAYKKAIAQGEIP